MGGKGTIGGVLCIVYVLDPNHVVESVHEVFLSAMMWSTEPSLKLRGSRK